jgi:hypothetical protein
MGDRVDDRVRFLRLHPAPLLRARSVYPLQGQVWHCWPGNLDYELGGGRSRSCSGSPWPIRQNNVKESADAGNWSDMKRADLKAWICELSAEWVGLSAIYGSWGV